MAGITIGVAIVAALAALFFYQASTANQTASSNNYSNNLATQPLNNAAKLQAGEIFTLSYGQKAVAFPLAEGFYKGKTLLFIHTDASNPNVASMMTMTVNYTTQYSPKIANVSEDALAKVYVFKNGVKGVNPFGFQSDVFDSIPVDPSYSPLRKVMFVTWNKDAQSRELKSVEEITSAQDNGELAVTGLDNVVIMHILQWDKSPGSEPAANNSTGNKGGSMSGSMQTMK